MENVTSHSVAENPDVTARRLLQRAHNLDGLPEIGIGLTLFVAAGLIDLQVVFPRGSIEYGASAWGFAIVIPAMILSAQWAIKRVRSRFLIRRMGYVEMKPVSRKRAGLVIGISFSVAAIAAMATLMAMTARSFQLGSLMLVVTAVCLGGLAIISGRSRRFMIGGVGTAMVGILIAAFGVPFDSGMAMLFGFTGLLALVSGVVVFTRFMRHTESGD